MTMTATLSKSAILANEYGYDSFMEWVDNDPSPLFSSLTPAICTNAGCNATYEYEPDQDRGYCDECGTNSVKSILVLEGII